MARVSGRKTSLFRIKRQATLDVDVSGLQASDFAVADEVVSYIREFTYGSAAPMQNYTGVNDAATFELPGKIAGTFSITAFHDTDADALLTKIRISGKLDQDNLYNIHAIYGGPAGDAVTVFAIVRFTGAESGVDQDGNSVVTITASSHGDDGILET